MPHSSCQRRNATKSSTNFKMIGRDRSKIETVIIRAPKRLVASLRKTQTVFVVSDDHGG
jgi:hypothetical protein